MFLNEDRKPLKDLSGDEMKMIVDAQVANNLEYCNNNKDWYKRDVFNDCLYLNSIYRVPPRKTKIDWSCINEKWKYCARDEDSSIWFYDRKPEVDGEWYLNGGGDAERNHLLSEKVLQIGDEPWQDSLIERPDGE